MFNLFKKSNNKKVISTETMSIPEYSAAIRPKVIEAWNDPYVAERITTKTIFDEGAKLKDGLTFEELKECDARMTRAIAVGNEFTKRFNDGVDDVIKNGDTEEIKRFCSATTIVNIIKQINQELPVKYPENDTRDAESITKGVNAAIKIMTNLYNVNIEAQVLMVKMKGLHMRGFTE